MPGVVSGSGRCIIQRCFSCLLLSRSCVHLKPKPFLQRGRPPWWAYPLFLQNFLVPVPIAATGLLGVTWSLAVEEQFYLIWPLVVRFCNEAQLRKIAIAVICISPALRFYLSLHQVNIYSNTFCRLDGLMAGALLAIVVRSIAFFRRSMCRERGSHCLSQLPLR